MVFVVAALGAAVGFSASLYIVGQESRPVFFEYNQAPVSKVSWGGDLDSRPDFVSASITATPAVVHIKSVYAKSSQDDPFGGFFGNMPGLQPQSSGSGVIISPDGYIATNNHVVKQAESVEVILEDKRSFSAKVVGTDPTTDLALLKIDADQLPYLSFGNSDEVQVGEWVLAVGNPFNLTSTVTAGIVSAKGRSLNILNEEFAIESFLQTDAAVNPGNSGGALINTQGQLVGINTAIASETGSYAGYSFAIPANIVRKVMQDLQEFGQVQRGIIGVSIRNINSEFAESEGLKTLNGAYVTGTIAGGAAREAGIKEGDVIVRVNKTPVRSSADLQGTIGTYRPGEVVEVELMRGEEKITLPVTLRDREGKTTLGSKSSGVANPKTNVSVETVLTLSGAVLQPLSEQDKLRTGLDKGVKLARISQGRFKSAGIPEGFVVTRANKRYVESPADLASVMNQRDGSVMLEGITSDGAQKSFLIEGN